MIQILFRLICNKCRKPFGGAPTARVDMMFPRDAEMLRREAEADGWQRYRPFNYLHVGDYCPDCVVLLRTERVEGKEKSAISGKIRKAQ